jgi:plastocyanin
MPGAPTPSSAASILPAKASALPVPSRARWRRRFSYLVSATVACFSPLFAYAQTAVLEGRVALPKTRVAPVVNQRYEIVSKGGVLATNPPRGVVYLEGDFPAPDAPSTTVQMAQKDLTFIPLLLPVRVGTIVEFPNHDDTYHNIFSYSQPKRFDLGRYRSDERPIPSQRFDQPGLVTLRCEIHEHMRGLILVLPTPHFVLTDADGRYRLENLPAGKFTLKVWLDSKTTHALPVELKPGETLTADFP